ncbi:MAG: GTP-binding protein [Thomasclavelia sp.]|jgi:G3E family GTPase|nr:GTP-binding protein [Thomasclavelia sp.]
MSKVEIVSGFLGAGKTTLIKKLIKDSYKNDKVVLIENEFGEIGIDGTFLQDSGVTINEINSGCICCSLVGDFEQALLEVINKYHPDRIIIEPSGVGKLSDIISAVLSVKSNEIDIDNLITVIDAKKVKMYIKNFGEFYNDQVKNASLLVLSRTDNMSDEEIDNCLHMLKDINPSAPVVTTPWDNISGDDILKANDIDLSKELIKECAKEEHHHDHEHEHHHDHEHEHHHDHENHHHDHEHHHHDHDADEVFNSIGFDTAKIFSKDELVGILDKLSNENVLRCKGFVDSGNNDWWYFDMVPDEFDIRLGKPMYSGKICVIGHDLSEKEMKDLFLGKGND